MRRIVLLFFSSSPLGLRITRLLILIVEFSSLSFESDEGENKREEDGLFSCLSDEYDGINDDEQKRRSCFLPLTVDAVDFFRIEKCAE